MYFLTGGVELFHLARLAILMLLTQIIFFLNDDTPGFKCKKVRAD